MRRPSCSSIRIRSGTSSELCLSGAYRLGTQQQESGSRLKSSLWLWDYMLNEARPPYFVLPGLHCTVRQYKT